jgi:hypothetical protein
MSISPVGNSDAYARYRQQALDLLTSPGQTTPQVSQTTAPSYATPPATNDQSSNAFATKFKTDLSGLGSSQDGKSHAHGGHGHHKADAADPTDPNSTSADATDATASADVFSQAIDDFANMLNSTKTPET